MRNTFVIGNGESRKGFDLHSIRPHGVLVGCNAIYREYAPFILFATDPKMVSEIIESGYCLNHILFTTQIIEKKFHYLNLIKKENLLRIKDRGWSTGPTAVEFFAREESEKDNIFMFGFDLYGIDGKHNNIYKGTENYRGADEKETHYGNWVFQLKIVFREHPDKKFYRVGRENDPMPEEWKDFDNIKFISYDEMWRRINKNY